MSGEKDKLLNELDTLMYSGKFQECYDKLVMPDGNYDDMDLNLMWRLARAVRFLVLTKGKSDKKSKVQWIEHGLKVTEAAVNKYPNECLSNTWRGVMLNVQSQEEGIKKKIQLSFDIQKYFQKGLDANPSEYITLHCMGSWCYEVACLGSVERMLATTFFSTPPTSTFEDALKYYLQADEATPNQTYTVARIALCYDRLKQHENAKIWAQKAVNLPALDCEMEEAKKQCKRLL